MFRTSQRGFTMGEVLLVTSLISFASTGVMTLVKKRSANSNSEQHFKQMVMDGRSTVDRIAAELRLAGLPRSADDPTLTFANSNRVAANAFLVARGEQIVFEADLNNDGSVERIAYRLHGDSLERSAVTKNEDGSVPPSTYEVIAQHVDNDGLPVFTFDGDLTGDKPVAPDPQQVRVMLLLRSPMRDRKAGRTRIVGFESVALRSTTPITSPAASAQVEASTPESSTEDPADIATSSPAEMPASESTAENHPSVAPAPSDAYEVDAQNSPNSPDSPNYQLLDLPVIYPADVANPANSEFAANSEQLRAGLVIATTARSETL